MINESTFDVLKRLSEAKADPKIVGWGDLPMPHIQIEFHDGIYTYMMHDMAVVNDLTSRKNLRDKRRVGQYVVPTLKRLVDAGRAKYYKTDNIQTAFNRFHGRGSHQPESTTETLSRLLTEQTDIEKLGKIIGSISGKSVKITDSTNKRQLQAIYHWIAALQQLPTFKLPYKLFKSECKGLIVGPPQHTEDAWWMPDKHMYLATIDAGFHPEHMLRNLIHEMGHAFEETLGKEFTPENSVYGKPPYVNNYAATNSTEDFAETFMMLYLEPDLLQRVARNKYNDMSKRTGAK